MIIGRTNTRKVSFSPDHSRTPWLPAILMLFYGFNSAVGTNLSIGWYYIHPAISYIDFVLALNFLFLLDFKTKNVVISMSKVEKIQAFLILIFSSLLIISTSINSFRFETSLADILPAIRFIYFIMIIHVIRKYTERFGVSFLINGFIIGVLSLFLQGFVESHSKTSGLPILWNPNVIGAIIGLGIFFCSTSLIFGKNLSFPLFASFILCAASLLTWSKGTWIMSGLGLVLVIISSFHPWFQKKGNIRKKNFTIVFIAILLFTTIYFFMINYGTIKAIIDAKLSSTKNIGSVDMRFNLILASIQAGIQNPIFGLGFRNFYQAQNCSTGLNSILMDPSWNAHNAFFQILATGGIFAFFTLITIFLFPFMVLRRIYLRQIGGGIWVNLILFLSFGVWFIYGSVQLQLIAQPPFWFFCGIVFGIYRTSNYLSGKQETIMSPM
jgi:hypothetical protein